MDPFFAMILACGSVFALIVPYFITRSVLQSILSSYPDPTLPAAATGVRIAAIVCFALGIVFYVAYLYYYLTPSAAPSLAIFGLIPLLSQWTAIAYPLPVTHPSKAQDAGFSQV